MSDVTKTATKIRPLIPSQNVKGLAAEALTLGDVVYRNTDSKWALADASAAATSKGEIGILVAGGQHKPTGAVAAGEMCDVVVNGRVAGFTALEETTDYYLSNTAGALADGAGTVTRFMGHAESAEVFFVEPAGQPTSA